MDITKAKVYYFGPDSLINIAMYKTFLYSFLLFITVILATGCTKYIITGEPENPVEDNTGVTAYKFMFNTKWKQTYVVKSSSMLVENEDASLEFTNIKDDMYNLYIVKHDGKAVGHYCLVDEDTLYFQWNLIDPAEKDKFVWIYGRGGTYRFSVNRTDLHYWDVSNDYADYYYTICK